MAASHLILGGARSGKSRVAEAWADSWSNRLGLPVVYLATGQATDEEMAERIRQHRARRPCTWRTVEEPLRVAEWLEARGARAQDARMTNGERGGRAAEDHTASEQRGVGAAGKDEGSAVVVLDCLSLLLNNWMWLESCDDAALDARVAQLAAALAAVRGPVIAVSTEAGLGIVPATRETRRYRDWLGLLNQAVARRAGRVVWVVAGIPVDLRRFAASVEDLWRQGPREAEACGSMEVPGPGGIASEPGEDADGPATRREACAR